MPLLNPKALVRKFRGSMKKTRVGCCGLEPHVLCQGTSLNRSQKTHPRSSDISIHPRKHKMIHHISIIDKEYSFILIIVIPLITINFCNQYMYSTVSVVSQFSSIAQAHPGYFSKETKFTDWLCKYITSRFWQQWLNYKEGQLYDGTNGTQQSSSFEMADLNMQTFPLWNTRGAKGTASLSIADSFCTQVISWYWVLLYKASAWPTEHWNLYLRAYIVFSGK